MQKREIPFGRPMIGKEEKERVMNVLNGHILTHGPNCHEFEDLFGEYTGGHAVTTSSCMASLHLSAIHLGLKEGDEVLVPSQTHVATVHAVELTGATPVFVDSEPVTGNMDIEKIKAAITPKTKAMFVVHYAGIPMRMDKVMEIADAHNIKVVEDCALAVGGRVKGKHVGLWGQTGCFSFYPVKHMTTAEGGMLISANSKTVKQIGEFRAFSYDRDQNSRKIPGVYDVVNVGMNYRMSELQAALGVEQVKKMDGFLETRAMNFETLKKGLEKLGSDVVHILDTQDKYIDHTYYCLIAVLKGEMASKRTEMFTALRDEGVGNSIYYPQPTPRARYYREKYATPPDSYKNAAEISDCSIALPVGPHLDKEDMAYIAQVFASCVSNMS